MKAALFANRSAWNLRTRDTFVNGIRRFALYLHDFGSQIGLRLAIRAPDRIAALIVQNGDIYEDALGPKYAPLQEYFRDPTAERRAKLGEAVSEDGFRDEFLNDVRPELAERISPDLWKLHWSLTTPRLLETNLAEVVALTREFLSRVLNSSNQATVSGET